MLGISTCEFLPPKRQLRLRQKRNISRKGMNRATWADRKPSPCHDPLLKAQHGNKRKSGCETSWSYLNEAQALGEWCGGNDSEIFRKFQSGWHFSDLLPRYCPCQQSAPAKIPHYLLSFSFTTRLLLLISADIFQHSPNLRNLFLTYSLPRFSFFHTCLLKYPDASYPISNLYYNSHLLYTLYIGNFSVCMSKSRSGLI